jgi:hypothetical protein
MRHIDGVYTQRFNRKYGFDGPLFRGRYRSILVDKEGYITDVMRYIHRNPLQAGLEEQLGEYRWTSHRAYLSKARKWSWLARDTVLSKITWNRTERRKAYLRFMREEDREEVSHFYSMKNMQSVLGSSDFIQWIKDRFSDLIYHEEVPDGARLRCSIPDVLEAVIQTFGTSEKKVLAHRRGVRNTARDVAMYLSRKWTDVSSAMIAKAFNLRSYSSVNEAFKRVEGQMKKDRKLRSKILKLERSLNVCQLKT